MIKELFIPVAAFAVTVTGASAFNSDMLEKLELDLSSTQISALEEAHELRQDGAEREEIKELLEDVGLEREDMQEIREAAREYKQDHREAVRAAIEAGDYDAFNDAVGGGPLADAIESEDDFDLLVEAHELREAGDKEAAKEIMDELGIERPGGHRGGEKGGRGHRGPHSEG